MKIKHVMSDGSVRDSVAGMIVPGNHPVYKALVKALIEKQTKNQVEDKKAMVS